MNELIVLPNYLQPFESKDLIRLGKHNDGGYVVNSQDVKNTKNLISLGISFDYSFEEAFLAFNNRVNIQTFDGSVGFKYYRKKCKYRFKNFCLKPKRENFIKLIDGMKQLIKFSYFFRLNLFEKIFHIEKFVTSDNLIFKDFKKNYGYEPEFIEFKDIDLHNINSIFLSIDIEGGEYDLLNDISKISDSLIGVNIEFHNVQDNLEKIKSFIDEFDLVLIHTHINNFGNIVNDIPSVIELSFSSQMKKNNYENYRRVKNLPIDLDEPNNSEGVVYKSVFKEL